MSEIGSSGTPDSRLPCTCPHRNGNWREEVDRSALRNLVQGMPLVAFGVVVNLISPFVQHALTNPSADNVAPAKMLGLSLLGLFSSSLASITYRPKLPSIASYFEDIAVFCIASSFASMACIVQHHWIVFAACSVPLLSLDLSPCMLLLRFLNWIFRRIQHKFRSSVSASSPQAVARHTCN